MKKLLTTLLVALCLIPTLASAQGVIMRFPQNVFIAGSTEDTLTVYQNTSSVGARVALVFKLRCGSALFCGNQNDPKEYARISSELVTPALAGDLVFHTTTASGSVERMRIRSSGFITLGGTTSSFPAIVRNGAAIDFKAADDSGYSNLRAQGITIGPNADSPLIWANSTELTFSAANESGYSNIRAQTLSLLGHLTINSAANFYATSDGNLSIKNNDQSAHFSMQFNGVPTCSSSCGTSPSVAGTDTAMRVTMGATGSPASPFTVTFNGTWAAAPSCVAQASKAGMVAGKAAILAVPSTTTVVITTNGTAPAVGDIYSILCFGVQ